MGSTAGWRGVRFRLLRDGSRGVREGSNAQNHD
jgi:hypothetical protein